MLAEERKPPNPAKRSRKSVNAASESATIIEATPGVSDGSQPTISVRPPARRAKATTARPVSAADRRLVERAEWMTNAMEALGRETIELQTVETPNLPARLEDVAPPEQPVILNGIGTTKMPAMRIAPPSRKKRHWLSGAVILTLTTVIAVTGIATVTPLATGHAAGLAVKANGPLGLPVALDAANQPPSGQWVALVGMQPNQDVGGGAGPGITAPGSAGLPVSSVKVTVNTGAPSPQAAGAVSAPPLSPWPPTNAFAAVPGYYPFGMGDVGGYYSWSFGQCTWWAQYERKDENLMHMGNAEYWANVAGSRGYSVGWYPKVGATVVFQPGVQGAGGAGHVAHVVKVYPSGWFLISEMNFYWNGGGWGRVDYRFAHSGGGVQFIY